MKKRILIVDDNEINRLLLTHTLQSEYDILEANNGKLALDMIGQMCETLSAVLLDIVMPDMNGFEVLHSIRDDVKSARIPVIMVTGSDDEESRTKALALGANDFIRKPYNPDIVRHCVKNNIALYETATKLNAIQKDRLTGLYSREAFFEKAEELIASREPGSYIMSCFDIDNFKLINERFGIDEGDRILRETGKAVVASMEELSGVGGRITGDNFAVLIPSDNGSFKIQDALDWNREAFSDKDGITFSTGQVIAADTSLSAHALYDRAYIAKQSIKGRYDTHIADFDDSMLEKLIQSQRIAADVDAALAGRQFEVWFQPQRNHVTGGLVGAEALVRWRHPVRGLIPPNEFIPIFEQNGFIYELDKYVWEESCAHIRRWLDAGLKPVPVSVNVSRHDVFHTGFVDTLEGLIKKYSLSTEMLRLEITESAFAQSEKLMVDIVKQLIGLGFTIEIDDFGSGYSSLNTLKSVPAQVVKLDMRFLEDDNDGERGGNILSSIVRMAKWLGMSVIAEGVEEAAQADYLASIGCSYIQGYFYSKPLPAAEYEAYCGKLNGEPRFLLMDKVDNLDNNALWDPKSIDTLIFSSYVGSACIFEYYRGEIELLRANRKFAAILGNGISIEETLKLDWISCLEPESRVLVREVMKRSCETKEEYTNEYVFVNIPGSAGRTYLRSTMRVIAASGDRWLVYCTSENITAQREAEMRLIETDEQLRFLNSMSHELLAHADMELGINAALGRLMEYFDGNRAYIFEFDMDKGLATNTYEVCSAGIDSEIGNLQDVPMSILSYWIEAFDREGYYAISDVKSLDDSRADERERLLVQNISSLFTVPVRREGRLIGMIGVDDPKRQLLHVDRLIALGDYIAVMLTRRDLDRRISRDNFELTTMMNDMPGGFARVAVGADGTIRPSYYNDGFRKLTGMSDGEIAEVYGDNVMNGIHPGDVETVKGLAEELLVRNEAHSSRYRLRCADGEYFWASTLGRVTRDAFGNTFMNIYFADVTEQVREEELEKSLMDNLPCGAGIYEFKDGQMSLTYQNRIYWELVGLNEEAYPDPNEMSAVHPDDIPVIMKELSSAIEDRRDVVCDIRLRHLKLGYISVHLMGRIVIRETGDLLIYATFAPNDSKNVTHQQALTLLLSAMMDSTTDILFAKDMELRYLCVSRAFVEICGKASADEIVGRTDADIFDSDKAEKYRSDDVALLGGGSAITDMVEEIPSGDGKTRYLNTSKYVLLDGEGKQVGIVGIGRDATEAMTTASRFELLSNNLPGGMAVYESSDDTIEGASVTYFSDGLCRLLGYTREEYAQIMNESAFSLMCAEDMPELKKQVSALVMDGIPLDCTFRIKPKEGPLKWINTRAVMGAPDGERITVNAVFFDVTEQKTSLEKLRISEEVNRLAIQQSMSIVCSYDVASRTLTVPESADSIFEDHGAETDVPYKPVKEQRVSSDTADAYIRFYESIIKGDKKGMARFKRTSTQGWRWVEGHFTTIFADNGDPVTAVISMFDVTETIEKDAAYRKWKQSIREKKPENYSLFRCNITRFTSMETYEGLLMPTQQVENSLNLAKRSASYSDACIVEEDRQRYLKFLNRDAMLLRYSQGRRSDAIEYREKLPGGGYRWLRLSVDYVDSPYSSEVDAYLLFENIDEAKRAELAILDRADKDQLTGLLNRSNFTASVEQLLSERRPDDISALFIIDLDSFKLVNDHFGHAVGDETLIEIGQKLRDTFRNDDLVCRLGGDEFMVYMGNVSGLSVVRERGALICALLHKSFSLDVQLSASIGVSVSPYNGSDFASLYRKADAALYHIKNSGKDGCELYNESMSERGITAEAAAVDKSTSDVSIYGRPKLRMLIVDDNDINRDYLSALFDEEYIVDMAAEGTAALAALNRYGAGISVVLLDLMMPGTDGFEVLKKMRESVTMQSIPVIVVSGMNERETALEAIRAGASDYITKPVDAELLKIRVSSAISKAENEKLRAQNRYLSMQNEEAKRLAEARAHSEELSVALHAAEKADIAKSQFLSSMSHEIRTPLNAVIGYNTIAKSEMNEARTDAERKHASMKVMDCLTKSEVASRHLLTIVNDVLDMSAIESGKLRVDDAPFDFRSLITSLTVMFFSQSKAKGVDFEVLFDKPTEEWFIGDQLRVNQVLTNLLSNAVKFTPEGGSVKLTVTERPIDDGLTGFRFIVSDTGIGMTKEYLTHIWTPFEQAEASISRRFGGSGLGLSITKNLVDLMGGSISVESRSGIGSEFTVDIAFRRMEQPKKNRYMDFSNVNALVVDDDASTCDYIKLLFDRCGVKCTTCTSGREAVSAYSAAMLSAAPYTICLIDWRMPAMDGFTTISEIRRVSSKELPIVVVTAYDFDEIAEHAESLGINRFISKPLFQSSLYDLLATVCGRPVEETVTEPKYDFEGARLLLVEDNNMNMEVAKHVLLSAGLSVDCAWNGKEAIDIFKASTPGTYKVILMDVHMPVIDGYEATRQMRAMERPDAAAIPIIAMTADVFAEDVEQAMNAGMNDHIAKPIDIEALYAMLASYLEDNGK